MPTENNNEEGKQEARHYIKNYEELMLDEPPQAQQQVYEIIHLIQQRGFTSPQYMALYYIHRDNLQPVTVAQGYNGLSNDQRALYDELVRLWKDYIDA